MIVYVLLTLLQNGSNMCITTSNNSYMADTIDYELDRSGRYIPAVVSGTYSLIDASSPRWLLSSPPVRSPFWVTPPPCPQPISCH